MITPPDHAELRRPGRRPWRAVALVSLATATILPVGAASARTSPTSDEPSGAPSDRLVVDRRTDVVEPLGLACEGRSDLGVVCSWSAPTDPDAVGVRLVRTPLEGRGRVVVYRSADLDVTETLDRRVRPGVRYAYAVQALDEAGRIVGASRPSVAGIAPTSNDLEVLRLSCDGLTDVRVECGWTVPSESSGARVLTLWRSVDGGARELVLRSGHPFPTSVVDAVPASATRVRYAVIAYDADRGIVARSRAVAVGLPDRRVVDEPERIDGPVTDEPSAAGPVPSPVAPTTTTTTIDVRPSAPVDTDRASDDIRPSATDREVERVPAAPAEEEPVPEPDRPVSEPAAAVRDAGDVTDQERTRGGRDR